MKTRNLFPLLLCLCMWQGCKTQSPAGSYVYESDDINTNMRLNPDHTFEYNSSFSLGSTRSNGVWTQRNDTVQLSGYWTPWSITAVSEKRIGTPGGNSTIEVRALPDSNIISTYYLQLNNDCTLRFCDSTGTIRVDGIVHKISCTYNEYAVKDSTNNHFTVYMSGYPIFTSPPTLPWQQWVWRNDTLVPIECGKKLGYGILGKK